MPPDSSYMLAYSKNKFPARCIIFLKELLSGEPENLWGSFEIRGQTRYKVHVGPGPNLDRFWSTFGNFAMVRSCPHAHVVSRCLQTLPTCLPTLKTSFLRGASFFSKNYSLGSPKSFGGASKSGVKLGIR